MQRARATPVTCPQPLHDCGHRPNESMDTFGLDLDADDDLKQLSDADEPSSPASTGSLLATQAFHPAVTDAGTSPTSELFASQLVASSLSPHSHDATQPHTQMATQEGVMDLMAPPGQALAPDSGAGGNGASDEEASAPPSVQEVASELPSPDRRRRVHHAPKRFGSEYAMAPRGSRGGAVPTSTAMTTHHAADKECAFCRRQGSDALKTGPLIKPRGKFSRSTYRDGVAWAHQYCARFAPLVRISEKTHRMENVAKEIKRARRLVRVAVCVCVRVGGWVGSVCVRVPCRTCVCAAVQ